MRIDAYRLLEHVLGQTSSELIANDSATLSEKERERLVKAVEKRRSGVPIAYITGRSGFFGAMYDVNEDVLIPRPETEHLVEAA